MKWSSVVDVLREFRSPNDSAVRNSELPVADEETLPSSVSPLDAEQFEMTSDDTDSQSSDSMLSHSPTPMKGYTGPSSLKKSEID